jgi:hypothetical protein
MLDLGIITLIATAAFVMLLRGDPKWTLPPLIGAVALSVALNMWGLIELEKLAYAASLPPFVAAGVKKSSREETFKILREASDPYEKFREIAEAAVAKNEKLAEPWESLRVLILPKPSEERELMRGRGAELYSQYLKTRTTSVPFSTRRSRWRRPLASTDLR